MSFDRKYWNSSGHCLTGPEGKHSQGREEMDTDRLRDKELPCVKQVVSTRASRALGAGTVLSVLLCKQVAQSSCHSLFLSLGLCVVGRAEPIPHWGPCKCFLSVHSDMTPSDTCLSCPALEKTFS